MRLVQRDCVVKSSLCEACLTNFLFLDPFLSSHNKKTFITLKIYQPKINKKEETTGNVNQVWGKHIFLLFRSGQPPLGPENFPQKANFFSFLSCRVKKYPNQSQVKPLITPVQKYDQVGSGQGPSLQYNECINESFYRHNLRGLCILI